MNVENTKSSSFTIEYKEFLTTSEAAEYLSISTSRLFNLISMGKMPYFKLGRSNRYKKSELRELLLSQPKGVRE